MNVERADGVPFALSISITLTSRRAYQEQRDVSLHRSLRLGHRSSQMSGSREDMQDLSKFKLHIKNIRSA